MDNTVNNEVKYAGFWIRAVALVIDSFLIQFISWGLVFIFFFLLGNEGGNLFFTLPFFLTVPFLFLLPLFYTSKWQATPGKRIVKIYVVDEDGGKLKYGQALYRVILLPLLFFIISVMTFIAAFPDSLFSFTSIALMGFWYIPAAMSVEKTAMHDIIVKTRVIKGRP